MTSLLNITPTSNEIVFFKAYLEALQFTEDSPGDLTPTFYRDCLIDCLAFYRRVECYLKPNDIACAGHDFWLTRNRHGAGFWDGDWPTYGELFTTIAESFGEVDPEFMD